MSDRQPPPHRSGKPSRWRRARLACATLCIAATLGLAGLYLWTNQVTAGGRPRVLWRAALSGGDVGVDAWPAAVEQGGYVEVWYKGHTAAEAVPLLRLPGAPPLAPLPEPRPGEVSA